jgi:predicted membrane channel-forming protein YqfA (hemolysin III family)
MTGAVWTGAVTGAVSKLSRPRRVERVSIVDYLALGWMILVGMRPILASMDVLTAALMGFWGCTVFHRGRFSHLASAALPEGYLAQLRAGRGQVPLRSYSAWCGVGPIVNVIATI